MEQRIFEYIGRDKSDFIKMPNWVRKEKRPSPNFIISYEIYDRLDLNEHEVVSKLQELTSSGKLIRTLVNDTVWYCRK